MTNKKFWLGMLVVALVFGMTVAGCKNNNDDDKESDTWSNVTSLSQVNGTWKAPSTVTGNYEGMKIIASYSNYKITFTTGAMSVSGTSTTTFSGGNINELWSELKGKLQESLEDMEEEDSFTLTFNDAKHSYTMTFNNFSQTLTDEALREMDLKINQNGTKLNVSGDMGLKIIYTKQ
ncbi:MAG: hypothetical protein LBB89_09550 [Treponema sp.]|jgi:hypothetical protein|nr:hypothetical protein [Treponema sp.]